MIVGFELGLGLGEVEVEGHMEMACMRHNTGDR